MKKRNAGIHNSSSIELNENWPVPTEWPNLREGANPSRVFQAHCQKIYLAIYEFNSTPITLLKKFNDIDSNSIEMREDRRILIEFPKLRGVRQDLRVAQAPFGKNYILLQFKTSIAFSNRNCDQLTSPISAHYN